MAKERKIPTFTPDELQQIDLIKKKVLDDYDKGPGEPGASKPAGEPTRPLLPNYYAKGGKVGHKASILPKHATNPYGYRTGGKVVSSSKWR